MKCENCGKEIRHVMIDMFNYNGSDSMEKAELNEVDGIEAVGIRTSQNWTGYELSEEEQLDTIECPECGKFPFKQRIIDVYEPVELTMWKTEEK